MKSDELPLDWCHCRVRIVNCCNVVSRFRNIEDDISASAAQFLFFKLPVAYRVFVLQDWSNVYTVYIINMIYIYIYIIIIYNESTERYRNRYPLTHYFYSFSFFFLPTRLMCSPAILAHQRFPNLLPFFLLFISSLPALLPSSPTTLPRPPPLSLCSKRCGPPSSPGSLKPAWTRRLWTSWTATCSDLSPRGCRAWTRTGRTCTMSQTAWPACRTRSSRTTTPSRGWAWPELPPRCRGTRRTTAAGELCELHAVIVIMRHLHPHPQVQFGWIAGHTYVSMRSHIIYKKAFDSADASLSGIACHGNRITMNSSSQQLGTVGNAIHPVTWYDSVN